MCGTLVQQTLLRIGDATKHLGSFLVHAWPLNLCRTTFYSPVDPGATSAEGISTSAACFVQPTRNWRKADLVPHQLSTSDNPRSSWIETHYIITGAFDQISVLRALYGYYRKGLLYFTDQQQYSHGVPRRTIVTPRPRAEKARRNKHL
jgi:hypothetical protein